MLNVQPSNLVFLKSHNTVFDNKVRKLKLLPKKKKFIITFIDQNGRPLDTEDKINLILIIKKIEMTRSSSYRTKNNEIC